MKASGFFTLASGDVTPTDRQVHSIYTIYCCHNTAELSSQKLRRRASMEDGPAPSGRSRGSHRIAQPQGRSHQKLDSRFRTRSSPKVTKKKKANNQVEAHVLHLWRVAHTRARSCSPRRGRLWDLRRCTMTPMMSAALTSTTASTEKLAMAASFHTSGVSSTDLPAQR